VNIIPKYQITETIVSGTYAERPEFEEKNVRGPKDSKKYNKDRPEDWFSSYRFFGRIILISQENTRMDEKGYEVFDDIFQDHDFYRIGIKAYDRDDVQKLYEELRDILKQVPFSTYYNRVECPMPLYTERKGTVYAIVEVKAFRA
jgi:hypothetical protein